MSQMQQKLEERLAGASSLELRAVELSAEWNHRHSRGVRRAIGETIEATDGRVHPNTVGKAVIKAAVELGMQAGEFYGTSAEFAAGRQVWSRAQRYAGKVYQSYKSGEANTGWRDGRGQKFAAAISERAVEVLAEAGIWDPQ